MSLKNDPSKCPVVRHNSVLTRNSIEDWRPHFVRCCCREACGRLFYLENGSMLGHFRRAWAIKQLIILEHVVTRSKNVNNETKIKPVCIATFHLLAVQMVCLLVWYSTANTYQTKIGQLNYDRPPWVSDSATFHLVYMARNRSVQK